MFFLQKNPLFLIKNKSSKRTRNDSEIPVSNDDSMNAFPSSLPPSSPPMLSGLDISENEALIDDMIDDLDEAAEEEDGEDLFGENMERYVLHRPWNKVLL